MAGRGAGVLRPLDGNTKAPDGAAKTSSEIGPLAKFAPVPLPPQPVVPGVSNQTFDVKTTTGDMANPPRAPKTPVLVSAGYIAPPRPNIIPRADKPTPVVGNPAIGDVANVIEQIIQHAGKKHGIAGELSLAVAQAESSLRPTAVSRDGHRTKGLFQLKDSTGMELARSLAPGAKYDPFDAKLNANLGVGYLKQLHDMFREPTILTRNLKTIPARSAEDLEKLAVAGFNAGQGRVARAQQKALAAGRDPSLYESVAPYLPASTRDYVKRVGKLKTVNENLAKDSVLT